MLKPKSIIISLIFILTGSLVFYFNGYKDNSFFDGVSCLLIFSGWIIIMFVSFGQQLLKRKKVSFKKNKSVWLRQKTLAVVCYFGFGALIVANLVVVSNLTNRRVSAILHSDNTKQTIAIVTKLEDRNSRGGPKPYAIIKYQTSDKTIEQAIYNGYNPRFWVGQKLLIKYSVDYPKMFEVVGLAERK